MVSQYSSGSFPPIFNLLIISVLLVFHSWSAFGWTPGIESSSRMPLLNQALKSWSQCRSNSYTLSFGFTTQAVFCTGAYFGIGKLLSASFSDLGASGYGSGLPLLSASFLALSIYLWVIFGTVNITLNESSVIFLILFNNCGDGPSYLFPPKRI